MSVKIVCISRTLGAGGESIGKAIAGRLRFLYIDEDVITAASEKGRVSPTLIANAEQRRTLVSRLMDSLAVVPRAKSLPAGKFDPNVAATQAGTREAYQALIREAIDEIAENGRAVIVAHAASIMLAGSPGVLRVLVTASPTRRAERLHQWDKSLDARRAAQAIRKSDRERRAYLREFYNVKEELPTHYDLVINTDLLSPEQAVTAVLSLAQSGPQA